MLQGIKRSIGNSKIKENKFNVFVHNDTYNSYNNDLVVKALDSQSKARDFKTTGWLEGQLSLSSFPGQSNEYQEFLGN